MGGDFNDILEGAKKMGERRRLEYSFNTFRSFVEAMEMKNLEFRGRRWTRENNRDHEGFVEARLDRFFGSLDLVL